uniref:Uncharacterized protein n=1 Tax=Amphimedon queenslandica TaxID=400682 RepID=A0A1X7TY94_AMPQE
MPPSLSSVCSTRVFTLSHVPKGARDAWAGVFAQELKATCSSPMDVSQWSPLLMLPKCILLSPTVAGPRDWKVTLELVRDHLRLWSQGSLSDLWDEVLREADRVSNSFPSNHSDSKIRHCKRAVEDGQY